MKTIFIIKNILKTIFISTLQQIIKLGLVSIFLLQMKNETTNMH